MLNIYPPGSWRENTWTVVLTQYYVFNTGHQTVTPTGILCLIFGNIAILTNSSTLISKITVAKLKLVLRWSFGAFPYDITVQIRSFLSFPDFEFNRSRNGFKEFYVYFKDHLENLLNGVSANFKASHDTPRQLWLKMWYLS